MAKKSTATRQANAARRSQTTPKAPEVRLVRQPKTGDEEVAAVTSPASSSSSPKAAKSSVVTTSTRPRIPEVAKTTAPKAIAPKMDNAARPAPRGQVNRVARAQASQRVRTANRVSPEQYGYVKDDLRLIAILAASMFAVIIILHFLLPLWLPQ